MKHIKSITIAIIIMMASANFAFSQSSNTIQTQDSWVTVKIKVKGITCAMDIKTITTNVEKTIGVMHCKAGKKGTATVFEVKYNSLKVSLQNIFSTIENSGSCENPEARPYKIKY